MDSENNRIWISESGEMWVCDPQSCVFCDNCTDIWYDSNGPYMVSCNKGFCEDAGIRVRCEHFVEENPNIITLKEAIEAREKVLKIMAEHKDEIQKVLDETVIVCANGMFSNLADIKDVKLGDKVIRNHFEK